MRIPITFSFFPLAAFFIFTVFQQDAVPPPAEATMSAAPKIIPSEKLSLPGLPNSGKVTENLFRGAQPKKEGYPQLKNLGISIVIDMHNTGAGMEHEKQIVESLGMRYISMPASLLTGPTDEQIAQFLKIVIANPSDKIFVHCNLGSDRTGVAIAAFRMIQQRWSIDQAYNEMHQFHFHTFLISMGHHVKSFPQNFAENPVFFDLRAPLPASAPASN
ncbi:MAG TPA: dual specificity protein phosphatase family protein [Candidatus Eremiobacteraceae bacterium]|nr:dual specificity protein phosphatase family protein [Candidatus Eremiobacteraceae bacterium]